MSAGNQVELSIAPEATFGTVDETATRTRLRYNSESLAATINDEDSAEIVQHRNITDVIPLTATFGGDVVTSLSFGNLDTILESALFGAWADFDSGTDGTVVAIGTDGAVTGTDIPDMEVGDWFYVGQNSAADATGLGWYRVATITGSARAGVPKTVFPVPTTAVAKGIIEKENARLLNGTTVKGFSLQKNFSDLRDTGNDTDGKAFHTYEGCLANTLNLEFRAGASVGATVGISALRHSVTAATKLNATETAAKTGIIYSPADIQGVTMADGTTSYLGDKPVITAVTLSINNNLREGEQIGSLDVPFLLEGSLGVEGTVEVYFRDSQLYDRFLGRNDQELAWHVRDPNDEKSGYGFYMPRVRLRNARVQAGGNDSDLIAQYDYRALGKRILASDASTLYTLRVNRGA